MFCFWTLWTLGFLLCFCSGRFLRDSSQEAKPEEEAKPKEGDVADVD